MGTRQNLAEIPLFELINRPGDPAGHEKIRHLHYSNDPSITTLSGQYRGQTDFMFFNISNHLHHWRIDTDRYYFTTHDIGNLGVDIFYKTRRFEP